MPKRTVSPWIKLFVAAHCAAVAAWSMPRAPKTQVESQNPAIALQRWNDANVRPSPVRFYMQSTGFWQYWDMFAPNPSNRDIYGTATIRFRDGSTEVVPYPRMADLGLGEKYLLERYRKFYERAHLDRNSYLWPDFARRMAEWHDSESNPPVHITLTRHWQDIGPPGAAQPEGYRSYDYFKGVVQPVQ